MPIRSKPEETPAPDERAVQAFIQKGGGAGSDIANPQPEKPKNLQLRLLPSIVARIDRLTEKRTVPPSRHDWFLEAILEKLEREERAEEGEQRRAS